MQVLHELLMILIGISGGIVVGTGMVALLTVLDIVPRLAQLTQSYSSIRSYEWAITFGATCFTLFDFFPSLSSIPGIPIFLIPAGLGFGVFVGLLAAALTEVINVIPILAKRVRLEGEILLLLMAMALGKVIGSLLDWFFFYKPE
ncbi:stage V sporulation protein AB [Thermicanus aegyptius]|uniref:stage V sporulation protein AB n=1 Tax=Thermicanus aegyptius TaxID=94009 RepID=UPI0004903031|nr:stage V sporulation protein AB [Thermicanus aegyptius]